MLDHKIPESPFFLASDNAPMIVNTPVIKAAAIVLALERCLDDTKGHVKQ
jgi:hypothetical protein